LHRIDTRDQRILVAIVLPRGLVLIEGVAMKSLPNRLENGIRFCSRLEILACMNTFDLWILKTSNDVFNRSDE
jgi:hypothetical protein